MEQDINEKLNEADNKFIIVQKDTNDILNELEFNNELERDLCGCIIRELENKASEVIQARQIAQIPYIGCIRLNPVRLDFCKAKLHLSTIRKNITKEQYKEHVHSYIVDLKRKHDYLDRKKYYITKLRQHNRNTYDKYFKLFGRSYAELYIYAMTLLEEIPFDEEWENKYQSLKD